MPLVEHNVLEATKNNIFGTLNTALAARNQNVETFVLISTDKAVRPTNVMGATKRFAEMILQGMAKEVADKPNKENYTRFCIVRFGNVLGSSGSVVPLFREQIRSGGPVTVTHPDIIRYFMTIPEAAQLVIQASSMGDRGDVFVLDMGEPVKIYELAKRMIHLTGLTEKNEHNQEGEIEIKFTGLRPGEKLYEELLIGENVTGTKHPRIMRADESYVPYDKLEIVLSELQQYIDNDEINSILETLIKNINGFTPEKEIKDYFWSQRQANKLKDSNSKQEEKVIMLPNKSTEKN